MHNYCSLSLRHVKSVLQKVPSGIFPGLAYQCTTQQTLLVDFMQSLSARNQFSLCSFTNFHQKMMGLMNVVYYDTDTV